MKSITSKQLLADPEKAISDILGSGEVYCVDTGKGNIVMMEEAEYNIMREAAAALIAVATQK